MKNYLYFGNRITHAFSLAQTINGTFLYDVAASANVVKGDLGGVEERKDLTRASVEIAVTPKEGGSTYFGTNYSGDNGYSQGRAATAGRRYVLRAGTVTKTLASDSNAQKFKFLDIDGTGGSSTEGFAGVAGDFIEINILGDDKGSAGPIVGQAGSTRAMGFIIYPEDSFLGGETMSATTTDLHFKAQDGTYTRDIVSLVHGSNKSKEILELVTDACNGGKRYAGCMRVFDGINPGLSMIKPSAGVVGLTMTFGV